MAEDLKPVQVLFNQLVDARKLYSKDHQMGANTALEAVIEFLYRLNFPSPLLLPLHGLSSALADAGQGIANPHIAVKKQKKGPRTPIWETHAKSTAAAAISLLIEAGDELETAAKTAARKLGHLAKMDKTLITYRTRLTRKDGKVRQEAKDNYHQTMGLFHSMKEATPRQRADACLTVLQTMQIAKVR